MPKTHSTARPILLRLLALAALILPPILYLISMSLALKTIYTPSFAVSDVWNTSFLPVQPGHTYKASPFYHCTDTLNGNAPDNKTVFNQTCGRVNYYGKGGYELCITENPVDPHFCQKLVTTARLYVAGTVLIGLALLFALVYSLLGFKDAAASSTTAAYSPVGETDAAGNSTAAAPAASTVSILSAFLLTFCTLLAFLAAVLLAAAQALGINVLVDGQRPSGADADPNSQLDYYQSGWYMGTAAITYASVGWIMAAIGAFVAISGCGVRGR